MMTPYRSREAKRNLQRGLEKMEQQLSPLQKVWRSIAAGRPAALEPDPVSGLQRSLELLRKFKQALAGIQGEVTSAAIVFTTDEMTPEAPAATVMLSEAKPQEALAFLMSTKSAPRILGMFFAAKDKSEKRFFIYPFDRTPEGLAKLGWAGQRQESGKTRKASN